MDMNDSILEDQTFSFQQRQRGSNTTKTRCSWTHFHERTSRACPGKKLRKKSKLIKDMVRKVRLTSIIWSHKTAKIGNKCFECLQSECNMKYLVKVIQGLMEIGHHSCRWFISDLNWWFQNALRDYMTVRWACRLCWHVYAVVIMTAFAVSFQCFLQRW